MGGGKHSEVKMDISNDWIKFLIALSKSTTLSLYWFNPQGLLTVLLFYILKKVDMWPHMNRIKHFSKDIGIK